MAGQPLGREKIKLRAVSRKDVLRDGSCSPSPRRIAAPVLRRQLVELLLEPPGRAGRSPPPGCRPLFGAAGAQQRRRAGGVGEGPGPPQRVEGDAGFVGEERRLSTGRKGALVPVAP